MEETESPTSALWICESHLRYLTKLVQKSIFLFVEYLCICIRDAQSREIVAVHVKYHFTLPNCHIPMGSYDVSRGVAENKFIRLKVLLRRY